MRAYPAFRLLLLSTLVADSGFWMYQVAIGWLALQMTDSPFFVGMVGFAGGIPLLLAGLPAGVIIDRFARRHVFLAAQAGVMLVQAMFGLLTGTGTIERWSLLVLVATFGTLISFVFPTRTAMLPSLVERHDLENAIALGSAAHNATRVIGPSLAGVFVGLLGVTETFAAAALMQALSLVLTMRLPLLEPESSAQRAGGWSSLTVGLRVVAQRPHLLALIVLALAPTVLVMPYINLMPVFARDELNLGSTGLGVLLASTGLGTVVGSFAVARQSSRNAKSQSQVITAAAFIGSVMAFSVTPVVTVAVLLLFFAGWVSASFFAINQAALQLRVEDDVRGRVISVYFLTWGVLPLGQLLVGALASQLGTPLAMVISCVMALISIVVIVWRFPSLRAQGMENRNEPPLAEASYQEG